MSDETSAAIAERVVNETSARDLIMSSWSEVPPAVHRRWIALVDAGRAAASSEPRTIPPLTDTQFTEWLCREMPPGTVVGDPEWWAKRIYRLLAASSDLDAIKREAAREALDAVADAWDVQNATEEDVRAFATSYLAAHHPAPVPEPPHVMVNGWRVTWDGKQYNAFGEVGKIAAYLDAVMLCSRLSKPHEADTDVVRVLALRKGRGDGHAQA